MHDSLRDMQGCTELGEPIIRNIGGRAGRGRLDRGDRRLDGFGELLAILQHLLRTFPERTINMPVLESSYAV
jgi:hypothetical protein